MICSDPSDLHTSHPSRRNQVQLSVLGLHREYSFSSHLVIEWEAAGNISKCKLTFNYTEISFRDLFSCQADSDLLVCFSFLLTPSFPALNENNRKCASNTRFIVLLLLPVPNKISRWQCHLQNDVSFWDISESLTSILTFSKCDYFPIPTAKIEYLYNCHLEY